MRPVGSLLFFAGFFLVAACELLVVSHRNLAPRPGIEQGPPALGAWHLSHWTTREVSPQMFLIRNTAFFWGRTQKTIITVLHQQTLKSEAGISFRKNQCQFGEHPRDGDGHSKPVVTTGGGDKGRQWLPSRRRRTRGGGTGKSRLISFQKRSWPSPNVGLRATFPDDRAGLQETAQAHGHKVRMALHPDS